MSIFPNTHAWEQQERNNKETDEEGKKRGVIIERSKAGTKNRSPDGVSHPNQNIKIINKELQHSIRYGKSKIKFN